jgi:ankyrin repeat protein
MSVNTLLKACKDGNFDEAKRLIDAGVDVNAMDAHGWTPLYWACNMGHVKVAKLLIKNGANVNSNENEYKTTPLHVGCQQFLPRLAELLIKNGADVNSKNRYGYTPLHLTCLTNSDVRIAELLIKNGADVNSKDRYGYTPLDEACKKGHVDIANLLLNRGAIKSMYTKSLVKKDINIPNKEKILILLKKEYTHQPANPSVHSLRVQLPPLERRLLREPSTRQIRNLASLPPILRRGGKVKYSLRKTQKQKAKTHKKKMNRLQVKSRSTKPRQ